MAQSIDLSNLKEEINSRKKGRGTSNNNFGVVNESAPKDSFLNGLLTSLKTGKSNESTEKIKMVENVAAKKSGENVPDYQPKQNIQQPKQTQQPQQVNEDGYVERDDRLFAELERKQKELSKYGGSGTPQRPQVNEQQLIHGNNGINESKLHESVMNILSESAGVIVERALKDAIFDLFTEEKIKEVIIENKKMIRGMVIET
ncbi:MAG: hypothetical protein ACOC33_03705, partial [bacterium]